MSGGSLDYLSVCDDICERRARLKDAIAGLHRARQEGSQAAEALLLRLDDIEALLKEAEYLFDQPCRDAVAVLERWLSCDDSLDQLNEAIRDFPRPHVAPLTEIERRAIDQALRATGGRVALAAKRLGIGRSTIYRKLAERPASPVVAPGRVAATTPGVRS